MTSERWKTIEEITFAAWELPENSRAAFLLDRCGDDAALLSEVRVLVETRQRVDDWRAPPSPHSHGPRCFGAYELEKMIGRGGMGAVYLAHRADGGFEQKVAVKIVGLPFEIEPLRERFKQERQILADLNHPHITHLIDGGITEDGELYLAMEFVDGLPLDEYVRSNNPSTATKLELFRKVASAVSYAHQNLIVHRDLKPSNILVTRDGAPKLLDFGTAKLLHGESSVELTRTGTGFMTVGYASPEQLRGSAASTLSDVYSLGALLYELMSGQKAFSVDLATRLESVAELKLPKALPGDLDLIVRKALDPEPGRRYSSVEQLATDILHYQAGEPVGAHPPTVSYQIGKFIRRHAWGVGMAVLFVVGLAGSTAFSLRQAQVATKHAEVARRESERSRRLAEFTTQTLGSISPSVGSNLSGLPGVPTVFDLLDNAAKRVRPQLGADPVNEVEMLGTIGGIYTALGQMDKAEPLVNQALAGAQKLGPGYENQLAGVLQHKCGIAQFRGNFRAARLYCQEALDVLGRAAEPEPKLFTGVPHDLAFMMFYDGAPLADVERMYRLSAEREEKVYGGKDTRWSMAMLRVGDLRRRAGDFAEAGRILYDVLGRMGALPGPPVEIVEAYRALAALERVRGQFGKSAALLRQALAVLDKKPVVFYSRVEFETELLHAEALGGEAADVVPRVVALMRKPEPDPEVRARGAMVLGLALTRSNSPLQAEMRLQESAAFYRTLPANRAGELAEALSALAECKTRLGRTNEAGALKEEVARLNRQPSRVLP